MSQQTGPVIGSNEHLESIETRLESHSASLEALAERVRNLELDRTLANAPANQRSANPAPEIAADLSAKGSSLSVTA